MTVQSSFLIRCSLASSGEQAIGYYIQHVQTGAEFRCTSLPVLTEWMTSQNTRFLTSVLAAGPSIPEDAQ